MRSSERRRWLTLGAASTALVACGQASNVSSSGRAAEADAKLRALAATSDAPIYYLGPEFEGMPADPLVFDASGTGIEDAVSLGPGQSLSIGYGESCSEGMCGAIVEVLTDPTWSGSGLGVEGCARIAPLRGVPTATLSGAVVLFTADLAVTLHGTADDPEKAKMATDALREVGQAAPTGAALPAPPAHVVPVVDTACGKNPGDHGKTTEGDPVNPPQ